MLLFSLCLFRMFRSESRSRKPSIDHAILRCSRDSSENSIILIAIHTIIRLIPARKIYRSANPQSIYNVSTINWSTQAGRKLPPSAPTCVPSSCSAVCCSNIAPLLDGCFLEVPRMKFAVRVSRLSRVIKVANQKPVSSCWSRTWSNKKSEIFLAGCADFLPSWSSWHRRDIYESNIFESNIVRKKYFPTVRVRSNDCRVNNQLP